MKRILLALPISCSLTVGTHSVAQPAFDANKLSDREMCALIAGAANRANAKMPYTTDNVTTGQRISVDCPKRTYVTDYSVAAARSIAGADWHERVTRAATQAVCSASLMGTMARRGWRFSAIYTFQDGKQVTITVRCN